jgi:DNA polymerase V
MGQFSVKIYGPPGSILSATQQAGVMLLDLTAKGARPPSLFDHVELHDGLMVAMDKLNGRYGRGSIRLGLAGKNADWRMRRENLSPSFTTKWSEIPSAKAS